MSDATASASPQGERATASRWLAVGGILGALGAASCCIIPFALFLAGVSGAWIGTLTALEPYQPIFAAISLAFIGAGACRLRKKRQIACADGYCATPRSDRIARIGLVVAATLVVIAVGFPYAARYFL
ncbi:mercuric transporter MerT family protein [Roseomonas sp. NAR14]|uniref:Mercuric transport protein MerT n=1 Tax=Roseomonas acroporae TaxID=2937791 RepID=A0A9X2BUK9_9PROT|nr:mercuric transporter MerT family protein [Roseomonas acroporae]MCK8785592.1 mercuric transporter MerT family protein [Roseomonas acroporae]